ncbi:MAG TPA: acetylornithine/succinylornithine family transaminase [Candidatus Binatia bacterium]|nr:acetylornithine/succinylornithine family transaminase [Candidatus Binatia bacterium]
MSAGSILTRSDRYLVGNYARFPIAFVSGNGCRLRSDEDREYLDLFSGLGVSSLGCAHPAVAAAVREQSQKLIHTSNLYYHEPGADLAERLVELTFGDRVFFCNSGAEANEAAIKMARRYSKGRYKIVSVHRSFHGRTYGALSATGQDSLKEGFGPMLEGFVHVEPCNIDAIAAAVDADTAAVLVEPIIGEGGILVPPPGYLKALRRICDESGALLVLDEVQTGNGRTGKLFAYEHEGVAPDILATAKGLAAGLPIGAVIAREEVAAALVPGSHGTTFGANPVCCAAALAVMRELVEGGVTENAARVGDYLMRRLRELLSGFDSVVDIRGKGLMIGVELKTQARPVVLRLLELGVIANATAGCVLRLLPPLVLTQEEAEEGALAIAEAIRP